MINVNLKKARISMVVLVITIIVLIVLAVIIGVVILKKDQLATFNNNIDIVQELVNLKMKENIKTGDLEGKDENYKWYGIAKGYTGTNGTDVAFSPMAQIPTDSVVQIDISLLSKTTLSENEKIKYYVGKSGTVYYNGYKHDGKTYYGKEIFVEGTSNKEMLAPADGTYLEAKGVNTPKLLDGMVAVYWKDNGTEVYSHILDNNQGTPDYTRTNVNNNFSYDNWYDYIAQVGTTENGGTSKWANAKTSDGSYWVWIPRYAYSITSGYLGEGLKAEEYEPGLYRLEIAAGTIDVEFLKGIARTSSVDNRTFANEIGANNWNIHPAFTVDETELNGIWVAKYEMSMENNGTATTTSSINIGDVATNAEIKAVSKPGVSSWGYISPGKSFSNALNYNRAIESHLMKNMEWGAVAYLTHSKYGRNGTEICINNSLDYITGNSGGSIGAPISSTTVPTYEYNTPQGVLASTTGNIYGIYDMSGGANEYVAAYLTQNVPSEKRDENGGELLLDKYAKYKEVYDEAIVCSNPIEEVNKMTFGRINGNITYGDAMHETCKSIQFRDSDNVWHGNGYANWFADFSRVIDASSPFYIRGAKAQLATSTGVFSVAADDGEPYDACSWRVVLWGSLN